jgi:hypothetical protein
LGNLFIDTGQLATAAWLIEYGGADISVTATDGSTVWDMLSALLDREPPYAGKLTDLLRVVVLRVAPHRTFVAQLSVKDAKVVREGARLRDRLPGYLARRRALLDEHCPLPTPLQHLVNSYEVPTTTKELWATGLGTSAMRSAP